MRPLVAAPFEPLSRAQRWGVGVLFAVALGFGGIVEMRAAFLTRRMTDLDVYLRAAWAVRTGADPYAITDDNGWYYLYPPLLAVVLVPLADPPPGEDRSGTIPFPVSVAIWFVLSLLCLALGTNSLARALESTSPDPRVRTLPRGCRRWWALRLLPVLVCITPIGGTLSRGQVNLMIVAMICAMAAAALRRWSFTAGLWLAAAICVKMMPAFLVLYPLWRRDLRFLAGCAVGLVLGLALLPAAVFGPARALDLTHAWMRTAVHPALAQREDRTIDRQLFAAGDNQAIAAMLHRSMHAHLQPGERPSQLWPPVRLAQWLVVALLTALTLWAAGRRPASSAAEVVFIGLLTAAMLVATPVCHLHYFAFMLPLMVGLVALELEGGGGTVAVRRLSRWLAVFYPIANALPHLPGLRPLREYGFAMAATLALAFVGAVRLRQLGPRS